MNCCRADCYADSLSASNVSSYTETRINTRWLFIDYVHHLQNQSRIIIYLKMFAKEQKQPG